MTPIRWTIFGAICVVVLGALIFFSRDDSVDVTNLDASKAVSQTENEIGDIVYGNASSKVLLIEYGDFQCPGCAAAYPQLSQIKEMYKDQIGFVFRHFPLTTIHPNALAAATVAEAAGLQGKFWEMHDKLYENQTSWSDIDPSKREDVFTGYAKELSLDMDKFTEDLASSKVTNKVARDRAFGNKVGVSSTPTVFINDTKLTDEETSDLTGSNGEKVMDKLDAALKANNIEPPKRP